MIALAAGTLGGAIAWSLHLVVSYLLIGLACRPVAPLLAPGPLLTGLLVAVSVITLAGAVGATLVAARLWRRPLPAEPSAAERNTRGIGFVGLLLNLVFAVTILIGASAIFVLPPC